MHIQVVTNRKKGKTYRSVYVRQSYREGGKVKKRLVANLSRLPEPVIRVVSGMISGGVPTVTAGGKGLLIERSRPHGHVAAVLGAMEALGLGRLLYSRNEPWRRRALAMVAARLLEPGSKCALIEWLGRATLAEELGLEGDGTGDHRKYYEAMDRLLRRQSKIEAALAARHLRDGCLVLYDVSSSYMEGRCCPLAAYGYSRDGKPGKLQIVYGLMCNAEGCPVAVEVFEGNTADTRTLASQVEKLGERFGVERVVLVGDRGLLAETRLGALREAGLGWITALRADQIAGLARRGAFRPETFAGKEIATLLDPRRPGERFIVCLNTAVREERRRKRSELLAEAELRLGKIAGRVEAGTLSGAGRIGMAVGTALARLRVRKHFVLEIEETRFRFRRDESRIAAEAALDGFYILRTSVPEGKMAAETVVAAYKCLSHVERAFRSFKSMQLRVRPVYHRLAERVRAHLFIAMLAYYVEWHLRRAWADLLAGAGELGDDLGELFSDLALIIRNDLRTAEGYCFRLVTTPNALQARALQLAKKIKPGGEAVDNP